MNDLSIKQALFSIVKELVASDEALRQKNQVGDKFRFIRERLQNLYQEVETSLENEASQTEAEKPLSEDDRLVFVYLYNAQGILLPTWQKLLSAQTFYDHSVNRPIYGDEKEIQAFISTKPNPKQHGYLIFSVRREEVQLSGTKDTLGAYLMKVKEGVLKFSGLKGFVNHQRRYQVSSNGEMKA